MEDPIVTVIAALALVVSLWSAWTANRARRDAAFREAWTVHSDVWEDANQLAHRKLTITNATRDSAESVRFRHPTIQGNAWMDATPRTVARDEPFVYEHQPGEWKLAELVDGFEVTWRRPGKSRIHLFVYAVEPRSMAERIRRAKAALFGR